MVKAETNPTCPECGAPTHEKKSTKPGILRWFPCTRYPACRGAVRIFGTADKTAKLEEAWAAATVKAEAAPLPAAPAGFAPSPYQAAIFNWIKNPVPTKRNAVVEAVAGSGKTTTMVKALELTTGKVLFTAFNASIAAELARRAPGHVTVSTLHSLGLRSVKKAFPAVVVDKDGTKVDRIVMAAFPVVQDNAGQDKNFEARKLARKAISLAKATLVRYAVTADVLDMMDRYGLDADDSSDLTRVAAAMGMMMDACAADTSMVDFDDMVWFPVALNLGVEKFDWVFVDETQDMNKSQLELVMKALRPTTGRMVCVGDRNQSIYGFRGADCEAIPRIIERLGAQVFPLSITYRCPLKHVAMAKEIVPALEARPGAPEGTVGDMILDKAVEGMAAGDLVMCRTNAPLVKVAFTLIRAGKKAIIRGREIGAGLVGLVRKLSGKGAAPTMDAFLDKLTKYAETERAKLVKAKKSTVTHDDKIETLMVLMEGADTVWALVAKIESIFSDTDAGIVCSSVHRAKGTEADRVWIVSPELMPHPSAKKTWEIEQEKNIRYVALTRSKREMVFVTIPEEK